MNFHGNHENLITKQLDSGTTHLYWNPLTYLEWFEKNTLPHFVFRLSLLLSISVLKYAIWAGFSISFGDFAWTVFLVVCLCPWTFSLMYIHVLGCWLWVSQGEGHCFTGWSRGERIFLSSLLLKWWKVFFPTTSLCKKLTLTLSRGLEYLSGR